VLKLLSDSENGCTAPEGVKLLGRWTRADFSGGFDLLETDDAKKLFEFAYIWGTLMKLEITPVLNDQELKAALENATKWIPPFKHSIRGDLKL
jgi:hypothetical protein